MIAGVGEFGKDTQAGSASWLGGAPGGAEVADWLLDGLLRHRALSGTVAKPPGAMPSLPFAGAEGFIGMNQTGLPADLEAFARSLPSLGRRLFADGLLRALAQLDWSDCDHAEMADTLVLVAERLRLSGLAALAAQRCTALPNNGPNAAVCGRILTVTADLATSVEPETADYVRIIFNAFGPEFRERHVQPALLAMSLARPARLREHLRELFWPLEQVFGVAGDPVEDEERKWERELLLIALATCGLADKDLYPAFLRDARLPRAVPAEMRAKADWWRNTLAYSNDDVIVALRNRLISIQWETRVDGGYVPLDLPKAAAPPEMASAGLAKDAWFPAQGTDDPDIEARITAPLLDETLGPSAGLPADLQVTE